MKRTARELLRLALAGFAATLSFVSFAAGETSFLSRGLADVEVAGESLLAIGVDGTLLRSTNDGAAFTVTFTSDPFEKPKSIAASGQVAVAVCESGVVLRSADAGATWSEASVPLDFATLNNVATDGAGNWIAVGESAGQRYILRSTDNGRNWSSVGALQEGSLEAIAYDSSARVWMAGGWALSSGRSAVAVRSVNGTMWEAVALPEGAGSVSGIAASGVGQFGFVGADGFHAVIASDGAVLRSDFETVTESLLAVEFTDEGDWIAGGMESLMIRFALAGDTLWTNVAQESKPGAPAIAAFAEDASGTLIVASEIGFEASPPDPKIHISQNGTELVITATGVGLGREYSLLKSSDLVIFESVPESAAVATGGLIQWNVSQELDETTPLFWKLAEN